MDVSEVFSRSGPLKRDASAKLRECVENGNIAWNLLELLYGLITACNDWCETIRDFLEEERGGAGWGVTP